MNAVIHEGDITYVGNYALIDKDGIVENIIWLSETNAGDFPNAVNVKERGVEIGDEYRNGQFFRDGEPVLTEREALLEALQYLGYGEDNNE